MPHTTYGLLKAIRSHEIDSPSVQSTLSTGRPNACNLCHLNKSLAWTAEHLTSWYGESPVELSDDERTIAASVLWALRGDAAQRRWSLGASAGTPLKNPRAPTGWRRSWPNCSTIPTMRSASSLTDR